MTVQSLAVESCSNLKVNLDLSKCQTSKKNVEAKVECKKNTAKAIYADDKKKWVINFKLKEGKWGSSVWKQAGPVIEEKIIESSQVQTLKPQPEPPQVVREIAQSKNLISYKLNGYFDFRFNSIENNDNPNVTHSGRPESGFSIEEAAFYATVEATDFSFFIDIPVRREKSADGQSTSNQLVLGSDRAQAYVKVPLKENLSITLGQFDTPYGVELNDSKDRVFMKTGLLYDFALPVTHTGVSFDGSWKSLNYKVLAANSNNRGSFATATEGDHQAEYGATLGYSNDYLRSQVGYLSRAINKSTGQSGGSRSLLDVTFGFNWLSASFDFEYASVRNDNMTSKKNGSAIMFLPTFKFTDNFLLGLRFETLNDGAAGTTTFEDANSMGFSAHWKMNDNLQFRSEVIKFNYNTQSGGIEGDQTRLTFTSLLSF